MHVGLYRHIGRWFSVVKSLTLVAGLTFCTVIVANATAADEDAEQSTKSEDAQKSAAFTKATTAVRTAMMKRDLATAKKQLKTAGTNIQTRDDRAQCVRLATLLDYLEQFWNGIRDSMAELKPLQEIPIQNTRVIVVSSSRNSITIKAEGRVGEFTVEKMPTLLVTTIADLTFKKDNDSRAIVAAFLAVDPKGDRKLAERYWTEAAQAGINTDKLLPELKMSPFNGSKSTGPATTGRGATRGQSGPR